MAFPYATEDDMIANFTEAELVELTNLSDPDATTIDSDVLDKALADAAAEMDAYLAARYQLEALHALDPVPSNLSRLNADIARYRMDNNCTREPVIDRYKQAIKFLENVVKGIVDLGIEVTESAETSGLAPAYSKLEPVFTRNTLGDFNSF